jgi:L-asparaginase II
MVEPLSVAVRRGEIVESVHLVHAVAVRDGAVVAEVGDPSLLASLRSAAKPLQALLLARAYESLGPDELAIAAASHAGTPVHVAAVGSLLASTGGREDELECGLQEGRPPEPVYHNCSGKHAGMIAVCRRREWPVEGYRLPEHPLQRALLEEVAAAAEVGLDEVRTGPDGCGVVCFAVTLERAAFAWSRFAQFDGGDRIAAAMRARPDLVGGEGAADTDLMGALPGWIAKRGAEGLFCAASPDGLGLALKVSDGNGRALRPAVAAFSVRVGIDLESFGEVTLPNTRGEPGAVIAPWSENVSILRDRV